MYVMGNMTVRILEQSIKPGQTKKTIQINYPKNLFRSLRNTPITFTVETKSIPPPPKIEKLKPNLKLKKTFVVERTKHILVV